MKTRAKERVKEDVTTPRYLAILLGSSGVGLVDPGHLATLAEFVTKACPRTPCGREAILDGLGVLLRMSRWRTRQPEVGFFAVTRNDGSRTGMRLGPSGGPRRPWVAIKEEPAGSKNWLRSPDLVVRPLRQEPGRTHLNFEPCATGR